MFWTLVKLAPCRILNLDEFSTYGRFTLGMVIPALLRAEAYCAGCSSCKDGNTQLRSVCDAVGLHATTMCKRGGRRIYLHDSITRCLERIAGDLLGKGHVWIEPRNRCFGNPNSKKRVDLSVHGGNNDRPLYTDVTIRAPTGYTYVMASGDNSAKVKGYTATQGAEEKDAKHKKDANDAGADFYSFSCEMYGTLHADCYKWLHRVGAMGMTLGKLSPTSYDRWVAGALQSIQIAIARGVAQLLLRAAGDNTDAYGKLQGADAPKYVRDWRAGREDAVKRNPNLLQDARDGPRHWQNEDSDQTIISTGSMPSSSVNGVAQQGGNVNEAGDGDSDGESEGDGPDHGESDGPDHGESDGLDFSESDGPDHGDGESDGDGGDAEQLQGVVPWTYAELATVSKACEDVYTNLSAEEQCSTGSKAGVILVRGRLNATRRLLPLYRRRQRSDSKINARISTLWGHTRYDHGYHLWLVAALAPVGRRHVVAH